METENNMKRVGIIGGGNAGMSAAYHFSKIGNKVCLYDTEAFSTNLKAIEKNGGYIEAIKEVDGLELQIPGKEKIDKVTTDIKELMSYSKIIIMIVPSFAQEIVFDKIYPYIDGHILVSIPGNFGSLVFNKTMIAKGIKDITMVDAISAPWACRVEPNARVQIHGVKTHVPCGVFPSIKTDEVLKTLNELFPVKLTKLDNTVVAGMENINFGGHPLLSTLSMGIMENFGGEFNYYKDACSPATSRAVIVMEKERLAVGKALGSKLVPELEIMNSLYNMNCKTVFEFNRGSTSHSKIGAPTSSKHRYITEDVPFLVVPIYSLGKLLGVDTPMMFSNITIAGAYNDINYFEEGRNLEKMGINHMNKEDLKKYLLHGNN